MVYRAIFENRTLAVKRVDRFSTRVEASILRQVCDHNNILDFYDTEEKEDFL